MKLSIAKDNYWKWNGGLVRAYKSYAGYTFGFYKVSISVGPRHGS